MIQLTEDADTAHLKNFNASSKSTSQKFHPGLSQMSKLSVASSKIEEVAIKHPLKLTYGIAGGMLSLVILLVVVIVLAVGGGGDDGRSGSGSEAAAAAFYGGVGSGAGAAGAGGGPNGTTVVGAGGGASGGAGGVLNPSPSSSTATTTTLVATPAPPGITIDLVMSHNFAQSCWVIVHGKALDITAWISAHPGGTAAFDNNCGTDMTVDFQNKHGDVNSLLTRIENNSQKILLKGDVDMTGAGAASAEVVGAVATSSIGVGYDFSAVAKLPHPGTGQEFKTLVYIEQQGAVDGASMFVNVADADQIHTHCYAGAFLDTSVTPNVCTSKWRYFTDAEIAQDTSTRKKIHPMNATESHLAMTHFLGDGASGWINLWNEGSMSVVTGIARYDHARSHFEVKDAAAKGVSVKLEKATSHGWLAKAVFAANNIYCREGEAVPCDGINHLMPDGVSLAQSAAGPNALEVSDASITYQTYRHVTGIKSTDAILTTSKRNYINPFSWGSTASTSGSSSSGSRRLSLLDKGLQKDAAEYSSKSGAQPRGSSSGSAGLWLRESARTPHGLPTLYESGYWDEVDLESGLLGKKPVLSAGLEEQDAVAKIRKLAPQLEEEVLMRRQLAEMRPPALQCGLGTVPTTSQGENFSPAPWWQQSGVYSSSGRSTSTTGENQNSGNSGIYSDAAFEENSRSWRHVDFHCRSLAQETTADLVANSNTNLGLTELLDKEAAIFEGIGVMQDKLAQYSTNLATLCPSFPAISEWAASESDAEIGMQLRAVAILIVNGVQPRVFQVQQQKYDTHANQDAVLSTLLPDLKTGVYTFVRAAQACGFFDKVLVSTFSDFGRRVEENSREGTDHGWANYYAMFGTGLKRRVFGYLSFCLLFRQFYDPVKKSGAVADIVPKHTDAYDTSKGTRGDLRMITNLVTFDACLLDSLALPGLTRLGTCPEEMRLRDNLNLIPPFNETAYVKLVTLTGAASASDYLAGDYNSSHLQNPLTVAQVHHIARRFGYSTNTLNWRAKYVDNATEMNETTNLTLQAAIAEVLSTQNVESTTKGGDAALKLNKAYLNFQRRHHDAVKLWTQEARDRTNVWNEVLRLPYPRRDSVSIRLERWNISHFFDLTTFTSTADDPSDPHRTERTGSLSLKPEYTMQEGLVLDAIQTAATVFFRAYPWKDSKNQAWPSLVNYKGDGNAKSAADAANINWWKVVARNPDVKILTSMTVADVIDDWACMERPDACTLAGTHPNNSNITCDPKCDLRYLITFHEHNSSAYLRETSSKGPCVHEGGTDSEPCYKTVRNCLKSPIDSVKKTGQHRDDSTSTAIEEDIKMTWYIDFTDPEKGLRARMTWFFLNFYAAPFGNVNDWILASKQYLNVWQYALGNYRKLALAMFNDGALRKSLDQLVIPDCGVAPIENFAREWFERFTVGLRGHTESDIKRLAKGLSNCKDDYETTNLDITSPGLIFTDPNETPWTLTLAEQKLVVDRILDYRPMATLPPQAALFLCEKLYREFGQTADDSVAENPLLGTASLQTPFALEVIACANHLYDHNYDVTFALEHIFRDKTHFYDTLGEKTRWPYAMVVGTAQDWEPTNSAAVNGVLSFGKWSDPLKTLEMQPFNPPDVAGWNLMTTWTTDRIAFMHNKMADLVMDVLEPLWQTDYATKLATQESFEEEYANYLVKTGGENGGEKFYSISKYICGGNFVPEVGRVNEELVSSTYMFSGATEVKTEWRRFKHWRDTQTFAIKNVCQFVC
eukprot:g7721.t1